MIRLDMTRKWIGTVWPFSWVTSRPPGDVTGTNEGEHGIRAGRPWLWHVT